MFEKKIESECGFLASEEIAQAYDPNRKPIWYCRCANFRCSSPQELKRHIAESNGENPDASLWIPILFLGTITSAVWYLADWKISIGIGILTAALNILFNEVLRRFRKRKFKMKQMEKEKPQDSVFNYFHERTLQREKERIKNQKFIEEKAVQYDPEDPELSSLKNFNIIKMKTECSFSKKSKVWGCCDWNDQLSLEENVHRSLKELQKGLNIGREIKLDGFVIEVKGKEYGDTIERFGETVRRVLTAVSDHDPGADYCMNSESIGRRGWRFLFDSHGIFVTSFAPCYPEDNARYSFGIQDSSFVLLQPQYSFSIHDIGEDHPWDDSQTTMRQKIRQKFKNAGRLYFVPKARFYPMAPMIVPPLKMDEALLRWYVKPPQESDKQL